MTDKKKPAASATGAKLCKHCGKPAIARADGSMMHDRRGRVDDKAKDKGKTPDPNAGGKVEKQEEELAPQREHGLARRVFGKKEE
jgi:hypothetical protein